jgi:predicted acyl esterase
MRPAVPRAPPPMPRCQDLWMPCPDGIRLATRVWSPDPGGESGPGPWPVLLLRQPYGRAIASTVTYAHPRWYAERGFVVAVQDVRGRGESEGTFAGFAQEAVDGAAAVRWARRLPEANGRVGGYGFSYQGLTPLLIEGGDSAPPGDGDDPLPDCLVSAMAGADERLHWASEGGAHWWASGLAWALQLAAESCRRRGDGEGWQAIRRSLAGDAYLEEGPALLERHDPQGMGLAWLRRDPASPEGWRVHSIEARLLQRPLLLVGGWHDPQLRGVLDLWHQARSSGGNPGLLIGDWTHLDWRGGIDLLQLAFFRLHLQANPGPGPLGVSLVGAPPPPSAWVGSLLGGVALAAEPQGVWFQRGTEDPLPPAMGLASDGRAAVAQEEGTLLLDRQEGRECDGAAVLTLVHDPWRPLPARGGHLGPAPGPVDRADLDARADVACFTTAPFAQARRWVGRPQLRLPVAADQPGFDLCLALSLLPAGSNQVRQLSTGFGRWRGPGALEREARQVDLQPLALQLRPGDRLRLSIGAAAWPAIAVNPGDGSLPWGGCSASHRVITLELDLRQATLEWQALLEEP